MADNNGQQTINSPGSPQVYPVGIDPSIAKQMGLIVKTPEMTQPLLVPDTKEPDKPFEGNTELDRILAPVYSHFDKGVDNLQDAMAGSKLITTDGEGYANAEAQLSVNRHEKALPANTPEWAAHVSDVAGPVIESLPYLGQLAKDAVLPAITGAGIGTVVPIAGTVGGALMGADAGMAVSSGRLAAGQLYMLLRREGATHEVAKEAAISAGAVIGALQLGQGWLLAGMSKGAIRMATNNPEIKGFINNYITKYALSMGASTLIAEAQTGTSIATQAITSAITNNPQLAPKDVLKQFGETAIQMAALHPVMASVGFLGGKAVKTVKGIVLPKTTPEQMRAFANTMELPGVNLKAHLDNEALKATEALSEESERTPEQVRNESMAKALDVLFTKQRSTKEVELELKAEVAQEETRTQAQLERDEKAQQLRNDVRYAYEQKTKAVKDLRGAIAETRFLPVEEKLPAGMDINSLRDEANKWRSNQEEKEKLEAAHEQESRDIEIKRLRSVIGKTKLKARNESRYARGTDIQNVVDKLRKYINDQDAAADVVTEYEKNPTAEQQGDYAAASQVNNLEWRNSQGIRNLADEIENIHKEGRANRIKQLADEAEERYQFLEKQIEGTQGNKPMESGPNPPKQHWYFPLVAKKLINAVGNYYTHNETRLENAPNKKELMAEINIFEPSQKSRANHRKNMEKFYEDLREETGLTDWGAKELLRKGAKKEIEITYWEKPEKGVQWVEKKATVSINRALDKLFQLEDPEAAAALFEGNGYVELTEDGLTGKPVLQDSKTEIEGELNLIDENYVKTLKALIKFYRRLYPKLSKAVEEYKGVPLPENPNYSGPMVHQTHDKQITEGMSQEDYNEQLLKGVVSARSVTNRIHGSTIARTGSTTPLAYQDAFAKARDYSRHTEQWLAFRPIVKQKLAPLYGSIRMNNIIERKQGENFKAAWHENIKQVLYGKVDRMNWLDKQIDRFIFANLPFALVGVKPLMLPMHASAAFNMVFYLPSDAVLKGLVKFWAHPIDNAKEMINSDIYKDRHGEKSITTLTNLKPPEAMDHPFMMIYEHAGMAATLLGVRTEIIPMYIAREYYLSIGLKPEKAMMAAGELVHRTQLSGAVEFRSHLSRSLLGRIIGAYNNQQIKLSTQIQVDFQYWRNFPTKKNALILLSSIGGSVWTSMCFEEVKVLYRYVMAANDKERENAKFDMWVGPAIAAFGYLNLPIIHDCVRNLLAYADDQYQISQGKEAKLTYAETDLLLLMGAKSFKHLLDMGTAWNKAKQEGEDETWFADNWLKLADAVNSLLAFVVKTPFSSTLHYQEKVKRKEEAEHPPLEGIE